MFAPTQTNKLPVGQDFVAVWSVDGVLFSESYHWDIDSKQYFMYDGSNDVFLPECDCGFDEDWFKDREKSCIITYFLSKKNFLKHSPLSYEED